jgi:hypothetical protein
VAKELSFYSEDFVVELCVALIVLAQKFRCDDFGSRSSQFHIFLLLPDSDRAAYDVDADKRLTFLGKRPVNEEGGSVRVRRSPGQQEYLGLR